jgi:hypothetical protein
MSEFTLTAGDTLPPLTSTLTDGLGAPINLTTATVQLRMRRVDDSALVLSEPATIDDAEAGKVRYDWAEGDTDDPGLFFAEWRITYASGARLTVPNELPIVVNNRVRLEDLPPITVAALRTIRDRVGSGQPPTDADLAAWLEEESGDVDKVVLRALEGRWQAMLAKPGRYTIEGDSSFDYTKNLELMQKDLAALRSSTGGTGLSVGQLVRTWER